MKIYIVVNKGCVKIKWKKGVRIPDLCGLVLGCGYLIQVKLVLLKMKNFE
jgi:hypothetical protein